MRSAILFVFFLLACDPGEPPAQSPSSTRVPEADSAGRTRVDGADVAFELPGSWSERPMKDGHDLRKGREEIIVSLFPLAEGLDSADSVERLCAAQQRAIGLLCKSGAQASAPTEAAMPAGALRLHASCQAPHVIATFVAAPLGGKVLSYEHYWYEMPEFSPELDRVDDAVLATLRVKATATGCPPDVIETNPGSSGMCLEAAELGEAVAEECGRTLVTRGWTEDPATAEAIGRQTAKKLACYRKPAK